MDREQLGDLLYGGADFDDIELQSLYVSIGSEPRLFGHRSVPTSLLNQVESCKILINDFLKKYYKLIGNDVVLDDHGDPGCLSAISIANEEANKFGTFIGIDLELSNVNAERTVFDVRRLIGRKFEDKGVQRDMKLFPFKIVNKDGKPYIQVQIKDGKPRFSVQGDQCHDSNQDEGDGRMLSRGGTLTKGSWTTSSNRSRRSTEKTSARTTELLESLGGKLRGTPRVEVTFEVDDNGILNVKAEDKGTANAETITITNVKGRLSQEDIEGMVRETEEFADEDKRVKEKIVALETYVYNMKNQVSDKDKLADKLEADEKEKIEAATKEALEWLDDNQSTEKEEYDEKLKEVEAVCNPIITAVCQRSGGAPGNAAD